MSDNPFDEFEEQFADVEDPSPFELDDSRPNHGKEVCVALNDIVEWVSLDLAQTLNEGRPGLIQYINRRLGSSVTVAAMSGRKLVFIVEVAADADPFLEVVVEEDPGPEEPTVYDPDKDNGF